MKDIMFFETEYGVASLVLKEIPYQQKAYITLRAALQLEQLIAECVAFCRACGAERVYATGHPDLAGYPLHTHMLQMQCMRDSLTDTDAALWPVLPENLEHWQRMYNEKVKKLPNGAWMAEADAQAMLRKGDGYFIHRDGALLGIGRACGDTIDWIAALVPGAGEQVLRTLAQVLTDEKVKLTVASANEKAVRLYEKMGFIPVSHISSWYDVTPEKIV